MKKVNKILLKTAVVLEVLLTAVFAFIAPLLLFSAWWMFRTWNNLTMDELMFHLTGPLEGTSSDMIKEYLLQCALPTLVIFVALIISIVILRKRKFFYLFDGVLLVGLILVSFGTVYTTADKLDLADYLESQGTYSEFIDTNYIDPSEVALNFPKQKRNLIYIFLESMETTYTDKENGGGVSQNIIPELAEIAQENEDFSGDNMKINGTHAMQGTTWTMGAMFAHTSGLPLNISIGENSMDTQESFFGEAVTLGDILYEEGYSQTLLLGSDATFGGRRLYFTEHGNYDIIDYNYARESGMIPEDYGVWWGYEDQKLFQFAKEKLIELAGQGSPFNLTMLTVDTHFEDGYLCERCPDTFGDDQYANVLACSSAQLKEFIEWVQQQDFYKNTTIVLVGDHLTMDSNFCDVVSGDYDRKTYVSYINAGVEKQSSTERLYSTFDLFPTTLAALGVEIEGNRLGLGANLFSAEETLTEKYGIDYENKELKKRSKLLDQLANINENSLKLIYQKNSIPSAKLMTEEYQQEIGILPISVREIKNVKNGISSIVLCIWTKDDKSDSQWVQLEENESGIYSVNFNTYPLENMKTGIHVQAYLTDGNGETYFIGEKLARLGK